MSSLIVHHYDASPYCEKVRLMLGHKGLAWQSVLQPMMLPKPLLTPLTGGYRRVPVLQIGADIYLDSALIAVELDRRYPERPLLGSFSHPFGAVLSSWADQYLFWQVVRLTFGMHAEHLPAAFVQDRAAMNRTEMQNPRQAKAELPFIRSQLTIALTWLEQAIGSVSYIDGQHPGYHDYALYQPLWFLQQSAPELLQQYAPSVLTWMNNIALIGHGQRQEISPEQAITAALNNTPQAQPEPTNQWPTEPTGIRIGDNVRVMAESNGVETITGVVNLITDTRLSLLRSDPLVGEVVVHLPRTGYVITTA